MGKSLDAVIEAVKGEYVPNLATDADCGYPDSEHSAGADFLHAVRENVLERVEFAATVVAPDDPDYLVRLLDYADKGDDIPSECADAAVPVYTHTAWTAFVDLQGYSEDLSDYGPFGSEDLTSLANTALYVIGERLAMDILQRCQDAAAEDATNAGDDE